MKKYIEQDIAIEQIGDLVATMSVCTSTDECFGMKSMKNRALDTLRNIPVADVVEVQHGRWINHGQYADFFPHKEYRCSVCDQPYLEIEMWYNYCPNCGAKMDLDGIVK